MSTVFADTNCWIALAVPGNDGADRGFARESFTLLMDRTDRSLNVRRTTV